MAAGAVRVASSTLSPPPSPPETVFIWSHPRALSTALLRSLAELPDAVTVLEPFMVPWQVDLGVYRGFNPAPPDYQQAIHNLAAGHYLGSADAVDETSHGPPSTSSQRLQIVKDMPCHGDMALLDRVTAAFPAAKHVLLVRHPFRAIPSYMKVAVGYSDELMRADISYAGLLEYAEHLVQLQHAGKEAQGRAQTFLLVDADDLIRDPAPALQRLCAHIGTLYSPGLLQWEAGAPPPSWGDLADFEDWLDAVLGSSGWVPRPGLPVLPVQPAVGDGAPLQAELIAENMPVYERLLALAAEHMGRD
jgi:hypothetical protein